jgi:tetrahydromethanopterin S-methyltransferase subunit G
MSTLDDDAMYHRRRADLATDKRIDNVSKKVDELDTKVDNLSTRVAVIGALLGIAVFLGQIVGPIVASNLLR